MPRQSNSTVGTDADHSARYSKKLSPDKCFQVARMFRKGMAYEEIAGELGVDRKMVVAAHQGRSEGSTQSPRKRWDAGPVDRASRRKSVGPIGKSGKSRLKLPAKPGLRKSRVTKHEEVVESQRAISKEVSVEPSEDYYLSQASSRRETKEDEEEANIRTTSDIETDDRDKEAPWEYRTAKMKVKQAKAELELEKVKMRRVVLEQQLRRR